jgi:four helix bundle protein
MKDENGTGLEDLRGRTKRFALTVIRLSVKLPQSEEVSVMKRQLLRSATSVAAHYRQAFRARSSAEFVSKMEGTLQELDESRLWCELLAESGLCDWPEVRACTAEIDELIAIFVTIVKRRKDG